MANLIYTLAKQGLMDGSLQLGLDVFKLCLLTDAHSPSAADQYYSDVSGDEVASGGGYTTGGATLGGLSVGVSGTVVKWDADDVWWSGASFTARYGVIYDTSESDTLVALLDFGSNKVVAAGTFYIQFSGNGIVYS